MFGYVFTFGRAVVALASVATVIAAYGFYELYRRYNSSKKKADVSDVIDRYFGNSQMHPCEGQEVSTNMPNEFVSTIIKTDNSSNVYQDEQDSNNNTELIKSCLGSDSETHNEKVCSGLLEGINMECLVDGFRELVEDRVVDLRSIEKDEDRWGLKAVDLYEELQRLIDSSSEGERHVLEAILSRIASELNTKGFVQIKLSEWNPEYQNAVVVTQGECAEGIKVIDTISSGVKRNGQVLRKQEVSILTSKKEN